MNVAVIRLIPIHRHRAGIATARAAGPAGEGPAWYRPLLSMSPIVEMVGRRDIGRDSATAHDIHS